VEEHDREEDCRHPDRNPLLLGSDYRQTQQCEHEDHQGGHQEEERHEQEQQGQQDHHDEEVDETLAGTADAERSVVFVVLPVGKDIVQQRLYREQVRYYQLWQVARKILPYLFGCHGSDSDFAAGEAEEESEGN
jgi:hypothetical protein